MIVADAECFRLLHRVCLCRYAWAQDDELAASISEGYLPNGLGFALMILWCTVSIGGCHKVSGMPLIGLAAVGTVFLSMAAGKCAAALVVWC